MINESNTKQKRIFSGAVLAAVVMMLAAFCCVGAGAASCHDGWTDLNSQSFDGGNLPSGSYYLSADLTIHSTAKIESGTVNLCLNGHTLKLDKTITEDEVAQHSEDIVASVIMVRSDGTLNLYDCSDPMVGKITGGHGTYARVNVGGGGKDFRLLCGNGIYVTHGTVNMYGGNIADNTYPGDDWHWGKDTVTATVGGGAAVGEYGEFNFYKGAITNNTASFDGGGVFVFGAGSRFVMNEGSSISENKADSSYKIESDAEPSNEGYRCGGGVFLAGDSVDADKDPVFIMNGGRINGNEVAHTDSTQPTSGGGGIFARGGCKIYIYGGEITENIAYKNGNGGGIYIRGSSLEMSGGTITGCTAVEGGGVYILSSSTFTMSGGTITGCTATGGKGGGVYVDSSTFEMSGGSISDCTAVEGGGVYVSLTFEMSGGSISDCTAGTGGGVYVSRTFEMSGGSITGCTADGDGGGVYTLRSDSTFTMSGGSISDCTAGTGGNGGGVHVRGTFSVNDSPNIVGNTKSGSGAANNVYLNGNLITVTKALTESANIWVNYPKTGEFAQGTTTYSVTGNDAKHFHLDGSSNKVAVCNENKLKWVDAYMIVAAPAEHGHITVNETAAATGATIKINLYPDIGYQLNSLKAYKTGDEATTITIAADNTFTMPEHAVTVSAEFEAKSYTVTLDAQGGSVSPDSVSATFDAEMPSATMPTKTGYTFGGFFKNADGTGTQYYNTDGTSAHVWDQADDSIIYAKWTANTYTVTFNANGGSGNMVNQIFTYDAAQELTANRFTKTGYLFDGWDTNSAGTTKVYDDKALVTNLATAQGAVVPLYAVWKPEVYLITYKDAGNKDFSGTHESDHPTKHTYDTETSLKSASKVGYTFSGWYTDSPAATTKVTSLGATAYTADITLYANWTANQYKVTFDKNGGDIDSVPAEMEETYGNMYQLPATNPTRTGYDFAGWYTTETSGDKVTESTVVKTASEHTLYAHWTPKTYTVTLSQTDATTKGTTSITATYDSAEHDTIINPQKTGYSISGWYSAATSGLKVIDTNGKYVNAAGYVVNGKWNRTEATTLYANWTVNTYDVTFNANGGTPETEIVKETFDSNYVLPTTEPTRANYKFIGWYTAADGGDKVTIDTVVKTASEHTIYAHWEGKPYEEKVNGKVADFSGKDLPVAKIDVGNNGITKIKFQFKNGKHADIKNNPAGFKNLKFINDEFDLSIEGTQTGDVIVFFTAGNSGHYFLAHKKGDVWEFLKAVATEVAGQYKAVVPSSSGFSPFQIVSAEPEDVPQSHSSSRDSGASIWLPATAEPTAAPTEAQPTQAVPTASPVKPTPAPATPAPFIGLLAGLGAAAVFFGLRRK